MIDIENLDKQECYQVPDGYFEDLPTTVMNRIHKEQTKKRNLWISSVAVVVLILICTTLVTGYLHNNAQNEAQIAKQQKSDEITLEEQMTDYYSNELAQIEYFYH